MAMMGSSWARILREKLTEAGVSEPQHLLALGAQDEGELLAVIFPEMALPYDGMVVEAAKEILEEAARMVPWLARRARSGLDPRLDDALASVSKKARVDAGGEGTSTGTDVA